MKQIRSINILSLPDILSMDIFIRLDQDIEVSLRDGFWEEVNERARASLMFLCEANEKREAWENSAFLRAGLNEFYSLEDAAKRDCKNARIEESPALIQESKNPLVHMMYLLRHVNVHAHVSRTGVHQTTITSVLGGDAHEVALGAIILEAATIDQLVRCNEANNFYDHVQLVQSAKWLDEMQLIFGVGEVFRRGLSIYCRELLASVCQKPKV